MERVVGVVSKLTRYPVKSMAGEGLHQADLRWSGFRGDREYAFVFSEELRRFPWVSGRNVPSLLTYAPIISGPYGPRGLNVTVRTPEGRLLAISALELAEELSMRVDAQVRAIQISRGAYDSLPISVLSTATLACVEEAHGAPVDARRFRSNILIDSDEREPVWRSQVLEFGNSGARIMLTRAATRCAMITFDPDTAASTPSLLKTVVRVFSNEIGEYASVLREGEIKVGDAVRVLSMAP